MSRFMIPPLNGCCDAVVLVFVGFFAKYAFAVTSSCVSIKNIYPSENL